jgi:PAS domain S-box-containing protein
VVREQRRVETELRESEARFRAMYDNAAVGMAVMTLDRKITSVNHIAEKMTGYTFAELVGSDPTLLSHPEDLHIGRAQFNELVSGKIPGFQMEKRFLRKNGEAFWGRVSYSLVPDKDGRPEYLVGIIEDTTEQRQANLKLAEQEAEYRRTLEERVEERTYALAEANLRLLEEIEQRERVEEALAAKAAEEAVAAERTRLAHDLHDAVTQTLFAASLIAEVLPDLWATDVAEAQRSTEELRQLTRGALAEMRTLLLELRPAALTQARLGSLIRQLCEALIGRARLPIALSVEGDRSLPPEVQVAFYRIAQESLNNVFKYARASEVKVGLFMTPAGVRLEICDNGVGFDLSTLKATSLGLRIMRERAEAIGAEFSIASEPGSGVCVEVDWIEKPDMHLSVFKKT